MTSGVARRLLYLDSALTRELLAGVERGLYSVERTATSEEAGSQLGGKVGVGVLGAEVGVDAGRTSTVARRAERDLEQTPESQFSRLVDGLRKQDALRHLETLDPSTWAGLKPGDVIETAVSLTLRNVRGLADAVVRSQAIERRSDAADAGHVKERTIGKLLVRIYSVVRQIPGFDVDPRVEATISSSPDYVLRAQLDATEVRVALQELDHATLLAKLDRKRDRDADMTLIGIYR